MDIRQWRRTIKENFPTLVDGAEACLSVIAQLYIADITNPFGLILVDVPSSGKTIILNFFSSLKGKIVTLDHLTPAAFVSQVANKTKDELKKIDLLNKIPGKALVVRDMSSFFSKREEDLQATMGVLTRVLDGQGYQTASGTHGLRGYSGDYMFVLLGASTPISNKLFRIISTLGSRLTFLNLDLPIKSIELLAEQTASDSVAKKEQKCQDATCKFFQSTLIKKKVDWDKGKEDKKLHKDIARIARLVAYLRSSFDEDGVRITEAPDRLNQMFYNFTRGHALICARRFITEEDFRLLIRIALSSASRKRAHIFRLLIGHNGRLTASEIVSKLNYSRPVVIKYMRELESLGLVRKRKKRGRVGRPEFVIRIHEDFAWFISPRFRKLSGLRRVKKLN